MEWKWNKKLLKMLHKLPEYGRTTSVEINLPQIVIVGAQNSGKSSVLRSLVGASILPWQIGTVTPCPIIVKLNTIDKGKKESFEFPNLPLHPSTEDAGYAHEVIEEYMELFGGTITKESLVVKVYSPNVANLTLVDLPGIKKLSSTGKDDEQATLSRRLTEQYIRDENAIILVVSQANSEIFRSDVIELAKAADPEGDRTLGVLTQLDVMAEGADARKLLTNSGKTVKLGMIGVVNRSQFLLDYELIEEKKFLEKTYPDIAHQHGIPFLRKRLQGMLVQHIHKRLPGILKQMSERLDECKTRLHAMPKIGKTNGDKLRFGNTVVQGFSSFVKNEIKRLWDPDCKHPYEGNKIKDMVKEEFAADKMNNLVSDAMILNELRNSLGVCAFVANPDALLRRLAQELLEQPALKCAERVHEKIGKIADRYLAGNPDTALLQKFQRCLKKQVQARLNEKLDNVRKQLKDYICNRQASAVITQDETLLEKLTEIRKELKKRMHEEVDQVYSEYPKPQEESTEGEDEDTAMDDDHSEQDLQPMTAGSSNDRFPNLEKQTNTELIKTMVTLYFNHHKNHTQDYVVKVVTDKLINDVNEPGLWEDLRGYVMENYKELIRFPKTVKKKKETDIQLKEDLNQAILGINAILEANEEEDDDDDSDALDFSNASDGMIGNDLTD